MPHGVTSALPARRHITRYRMTSGLVGPAQCRGQWREVKAVGRNVATAESLRTLTVESVLPMTMRQVDCHDRQPPLRFANLHQHPILLRCAYTPRAAGTLFHEGACRRMSAPEDANAWSASTQVACGRAHYRTVGSNASSVSICSSVPTEILRPSPQAENLM